MSVQNDIERIQDLLSRNEISVDEANVSLVIAQGVKLKTGAIPTRVRRALNAAVKTGKLGHLPKKGLLPESYFNPNQRARAIEMRRQKERDVIEAMQSICAQSSSCFEIAD